MEYSINKEKQTIHAKFLGAMKSETLIQHILTIRADKYFQKGFNIVIDLRSAHVPKGYMQIAQIADFVKITSVRRSKFKLALLADNPEQIRSARLYALLVGQRNIQVCQSIKTAEDWVSHESVPERISSEKIEDNIP